MAFGCRAVEEVLCLPKALFLVALPQSFPVDSWHFCRFIAKISIDVYTALKPMRNHPRNCSRICRVSSGLCAGRILPWRMKPTNSDGRRKRRSSYLNSLRARDQSHAWRVTASISVNGVNCRVGGLRLMSHLILYSVTSDAFVRRKAHARCVSVTCTMHSVIGLMSSLRDTPVLLTLWFTANR